MALNNSERIGRCLDSLKNGLAPYFVREVRAKFDDEKWIRSALEFLDRPQFKEARDLIEKNVNLFIKKVDINALLHLVRCFDRDVFFY